MPDDDRAWRRQVGRDALQRADPIARQRTEPHPDFGRRGRDRVVLASLDAHHARRLGSAEAHRERRPERDWHLAEEVAHTPSAEYALDPIDEPDRLDASFEDREQRALLARVDRELARYEPDVRRASREPFALDLADIGEERDAGDLFWCQHDRPQRP